MIGAAVCLRVAGHDVIRPRPSEVPRASELAGLTIRGSW
jgi:hypothetical protein